MIALQKQADHSAQLSLQEMWRTQHQGSPPSCSAIGVGDALFRKIQCLLRAAVPTSHHLQCDSMRQMELVSMGADPQRQGLEELPASEKSTSGGTQGCEGAVSGFKA